MAQLHYCQTALMISQVCVCVCVCRCGRSKLEGKQQRRASHKRWTEADDFCRIKPSYEFMDDSEPLFELLQIFFYKGPKLLKCICTIVVAYIRTKRRAALNVDFTESLLRLTAPLLTSA